MYFLKKCDIFINKDLFFCRAIPGLVNEMDGINTGRRITYDPNVVIGKGSEGTVYKVEHLHLLSSNQETRIIIHALFVSIIVIIEGNIRHARGCRQKDSKTIISTFCERGEFVERDL